MTTVNRFYDSKIYKLYHEDGHYYIGCTTQNISSRLNDHKLESKQNINHGRLVYKYIKDHGGWDKVKIILIERFRLNDRSELLREEDRYIQANKHNPMCLNSMGPSRQTIPEITKMIQPCENESVHNKYNDSKIYRIISHEGYYYFGSTILNLATRLRNHQTRCMNGKGQNRKLFIYFTEHGWDKAEIQLVSSHNFDTNKQLREEENKHIDMSLKDPKCLNEIRAVKSAKADRESRYNYIASHQEQRQNTRKKYYESHKCVINEKVICECGSTVSRSHLIRHKKEAKKHLEFVKSTFIGQ